MTNNRTYSRNHEGGKGLTLCSTRSADGGRTWSALRPVEEPETERDCQVRFAVG